MNRPKTRRPLALASATAISLSVFTAADGATITSSWLAAVTNTWTAPAAWSAGVPRNGVPADATYSAVIDAAGSPYSVNLATTLAVDALRLDSADATLNHTAGTLTVGAGTVANGAYLLNGGTLSITDSLNIAGGSFSFAGGTLGGAGSVTVAAGGQFVFGTLGASRTLSTTITNAGNLKFGAAQISLNNGTLINDGTAVFLGQSVRFSTTNAATSAVVNNGTFAFGFGSFSSGAFVNNGTITVADRYDGLFLDAGSTTFNAGSRITGAGAFTVPTSATFVAAGATTFDNAGTTLSGGTLSGAGDVTFNNSLNFSSGTISGTGKVIVGPAATATLTSFYSGLSRTLSRRLENAGTLLFGSNPLRLNNGTLINNGTAVFSEGSTTASFLATDPAISAVVNNGTFLSTSGATLGGFTNNGTVSLANYVTLNVASGTTVLNAGSKITGNGFFTVTGTAVVNVPAPIAIDATGFVLNGGTIAGPGTITISAGFSFNNGTLAAGGPLIIAPTGTGTYSEFFPSRFLSRSLENNGTFNFLGSNGTLTLDNGTFTNNGTSTFSRDMPFKVNDPATSAVINNGTFVFTGGSGIRAISPFVNNGTIVANAEIALAAGGVVTFNDQSRVVGSFGFDVTSGTLTANGQTTFDNSTLYIGGGTLKSDGTVTVSKRLIFASGTLTSAAGRVVLGNLSSSTFDVGSGVTFGSTRTLSTRLQNDGTLTLGTASLTLNSGTFINNGSTILNRSGLQMTVVDPTTSAVVNNGTLTVGFGSYSMPALTNSGTLSAGSFGTLIPGIGTSVFNDGAYVGGTGTLSILAGRSLDVSGTAIFAGITALGGGAIAGSGTMLVTGTLTFNTGTLSAGGKTVIAPTATTMTRQGAPGPRVIAREFINNGTLNSAVGSVTLDAGTLINNGTAIFPAAANFIDRPTPANSAIVNAGTFLLGAGTFDLGAITNTGTIAVASAATLTVNTAFGGVGTIDVGSTFSPNVSLPTQVVIGSGTFAPPTSLVVGGTQARTLIIPSGTTLTVQPNSTYTGTSRVTDLAIASDGTEPAARLDITDNALIVDYDNATSPGTTKYDEVRALIVTGRANGAFTGNGITSSTAAASVGGSGVGAVAIAEAGELFDAFPATFAGQSVDSTTILTRYASLGDANLDQTVDTVDFARLVAGFATSTRWAGGDFNYDGVVSSVDFNALVANYGKTVAIAAPGELPGGLVPEPAAVSFLTLAGLGLSRRRAMPKRAK